MSNRAWMPLHIADYLADTGHLTATEHGAYLLLIMHYWQNGRLPENERVIARIAKLTPEQWEESRDMLAMLFGPGWTHKRIDAELSKADDIIEKRRAAAESRYSKGKNQPSDANAVHVQSKSSDTGVPPTTSDLSSLRSDQTEKETRERDQFSDWFNSWPSAASDNDDDAFAAWRELTDADRSEAKARSAAYVEAAKGGGRTAICSAAKYLRKRMWKRLDNLKPPDKPPPKANGLAHLQKPQTREEYLAEELEKSERSFKR
ncbi:YdaU family protein [Rhizobium ruizarguesonis]|uniref:YdaU family protein n=1 Tax=Rhizobium ruizarguesonis TaxID=2081791 RepID=UPI0003F98B4C|nr:DUF1376 domain-containing protein [Rhizobium ruizarguesonis]QJS27449.1 YdaU family protein [Rhizobium leguminosarum bv. trifolii TA1]UFW96202.1 YdaU family protein [Rhizobium ruizarguesonis]